MSFFLQRFTQVLCIGAVLGVSAQAATAPRMTAQPRTRIVKKIDNADVRVVAHTSPAVIANAVDKGRIAASTQFNHMMLVLKSTDEQEFALHGLLDQQQDKSSANYHQWATPETFGTHFGVASTDLSTITAWLQDSGFTVETVTKGARIIEFSGTSGRVEAAFHTEMHRYSMNGEMHVANAMDISIPKAISEVVVGLSSLNDFRPKAHVVNRRNLIVGPDKNFYSAIPGTSEPDYTSASTGNHYAGPGDLATIFDSAPLLAAGINGAGVKIGIIGQTDILLSDVQIYRSAFGLPKNDPTFTQIGGDPGTIGDDIESDLDVELSGGVAPMASVNFVTSGNSYFGGGIDASAVYLVENNNADILSLSYGECEANLGAAGNAFYQVLWEQAAAQGQTVFVSSGDSGPATCNSSSATYGSAGYGVNGLGSTPYNVSVGGTMFNEGNTPGVTPYWGPAAGFPYSTALSYIPEVPWNEGVGGSKTLSGLAAAGSGISLYYGTPSFQTGPGVPTTDPIVFPAAVVPGPHRYMPDVSLVAAAAHDATIFCAEGSCKLNSAGLISGIGAVGGTSVATPVMAGMQALINQKNGGRQGLANYYYYRLAAAQSQTSCISSTLPSAAGTGCAFHDIATGNVNIPANAAGTSVIGFTAAPGYDLAIGLGSADVNNLATLWSTVSFNATTTAFTLTPTTGAHGQTETVTLKVAPVSGTGTPTGDVSIIATAAYGGLGYYTLANGAASGTLTGLPAGTYTVYAHYAGDATYGGSNSAPVTVTLSAETSAVNATPYVLLTTGALSPTTSFSYGANVYIDASVVSPSGTGTPTGNITYTLNNGTSILPPSVTPLDSFDDSYFDAGLGYAGYDIKPTYPLLPVGTYLVTVSYAGDATFNAASATPFTITVGPVPQALALRAVTAEVASGGVATLNASIATVAAAAGGSPATGTVTFFDSGVSIGSGTLTGGAVVFTTTALLTAGPHTITAKYTGDGNYQMETSAAVTVTVGGSATTLGLTVSAMSFQVGTSLVLTATAPTGSTGTVYFYSDGVSLGGATVSATTALATATITSFQAGMHTITATYSGNTTKAGSSSTPVVIMVAQNTPSVQLTSQQNNSTGGTVAMNAVLTPSPAGVKPNNPAPTGALTFLDGTTVLGTATTAYQPGGYQTYVAAFATSALKPGVHTLISSYIGDANFAAALSNTQTVNIGLTTLAVTSSTTSVHTGVPFTVTATITPLVANTAAIGGTVTFYDGTTLVGTVPVTAGVAMLKTATLSTVGTHTITAYYSGDANYYMSATTLAVTIAVLGDVYVADSSRVEVFTTSGTFLTQFSITGGQKFPFGAAGLAVDPHGNVFLTDSANKNVSEFDNNGNFVRTFGSYGSGNGQFTDGIGGIAIGSNGSVIVADSGNDRVEIFSNAGAYLSQIGTRGHANGQFVTPVGVATDAAGNIYIADSSRVQQFTSSGAFLKQFSLTTAGGFLFGPGSLAVDLQGNILVTDVAAKRVTRFDPNGNILQVIGTYGTGNGQMSNGAVSVAVDYTGTVQVGDSGSNRLESFDSTGLYELQFGTTGNNPGQFDGSTLLVAAPH